VYALHLHHLHHHPPTLFAQNENHICPLFARLFPHTLCPLDPVHQPRRL